MRWEDLFRDLEAQLDAEESAELDAEVADRTRREAALLGVVDRARAAVGHPVQLRVSGAGALEGTLTEVARTWLLLLEPTGREALVPWAAVVSMSGLLTWSGVPGAGGQVAARAGFGSVLRRVARDRLPVQITLVDGAVLGGTVDRVGADFLELTQHASAEFRRRGEVSGVRTIPFHALTVLRRQP